MLYTDAPSIHPTWRTPHQNLNVCIFETVGLTAAPLSVHPVLKLQSWHISVLIQTKRLIDRRCPLLDRWIIRCYYLLRFVFWQSSGASNRWTVGSFDSFYSLEASQNVPTTSTLLLVYRWWCPFFFLHVFNLSLLQLNMLNMPSLIASKYIPTPHLCYEQVNMCKVC
jgi:hypothetical protein